MRAEKDGKRDRYLYRKTVKDHEYVYFRMPNGKLIRLPQERSPEFNRSYDACLKALTKPVLRESKPARIEKVTYFAGTFGAAIKKYRGSSGFEKKKPSSKRVYGIALAEMESRLGMSRLADLDLDAVDIYAEQIARQHGDAMADLHVTLIGNIWKTCRKFPEFKIKGKQSPTVGAEKHHTLKRAAKPWSDEAQSLFMETASQELQLAKLLLHFSAQRGGDCVRMKWADFDGEGIFVKPEKTDDGTEPEMEYLLCPKPLLDALLARQKKRDLAETILTNSRGKPWATSQALSCAIRRHLIRIGLAQIGMKTISMHGLRKNAASDVGSLLVGTAGIKSVTKHKSDAMAAYYAKHAEQIAMNRKVVERWNEEIANKAARTVAKRRATLRRV